MVLDLESIKGLHCSCADGDGIRFVSREQESLEPIQIFLESRPLCLSGESLLSTIRRPYEAPDSHCGMNGNGRPQHDASEARRTRVGEEHGSGDIV